MFRELELYAGNKWFVYIDARIRQFLDEAETSLVECKSPSIPATSGVTGPKSTTSFFGEFSTTTAEATTPLGITDFTTTLAPLGGECDTDPVDLLFILDTSTSVEKEFYAEKNFALDLVKVLPNADFQVIGQCDDISYMVIDIFRSAFPLPYRNSTAQRYCNLDSGKRNLKTTFYTPLSALNIRYFKLLTHMSLFDQHFRI